MPRPAVETMEGEMNLAALAKSLEDKQRARRTQAHSRPWQPTMTPATSLGYECERRTVYQRTQSEKAQPVGEELASIFEEGNLHQTDVRIELAKLGFEVVEAEVNFKDRALEISGTIDGKILVPDESAHHGFRRIPVEIKSTMGSAPHTADEWRNHDNSLMRRYYGQLQTYLYLSGEPEGLGIFKDKATGLWTVCPAPLDYEYTEGLLRRAERLREATRAVLAHGEEAMPPRLASRAECDGCPFRDTVCHPADAAVDPLLVAMDEELLAQLVEREQHDPAATRFDRIDKAVKERFKLTKGDRFIVGGADGFLVTKRPHGKGIRVDIARLASK